MYKVLLKLISSFFSIILLIVRLRNKVRENNEEAKL